MIPMAEETHMENQLTWDEQYKLGVELIDREHEKLFHILNKLYAIGRQKEKSHFACQEAVKYFKDHTLQHFADEEDYMASIGYTGLETHKRIHRDFRKRTLPALETELEKTNYSRNSINHFFGVCAGWLVGHTLTEDHLIMSGEPVKHWENLLPEEEQAVMEQAVACLLHNMFHSEPKLISNCYNGESFGNGFCYRLSCSTTEGSRREFFLIFEKQLISSTVGNVMELESKVIDVMLMNVAGYIARRLVERGREYFPSSEQFEITEEHLLTYEQFHSTFERLSPQFSLLFDTGKGYFAYCMVAADAFHGEDGVSFLTEHAMAEVANRMNQSEGEKASPRQKKKLLIVDDSSFTLTLLQNLLGTDYEVITAKSGLSAIRHISLMRPDLILLDYEMPVCSGNQVLEMLRSEEDFTDIPVIFLTSRVDRESIQKVIALKPERYLSKALPPETVKREIDRFFEKGR